MTDHLDVILRDGLHEDGPDGILLMRLLGEAATEDAARAAMARTAAALADARDTAGLARIRRLEALWAAHPQAWTVVRSVLALASHEPSDEPPAVALRRWAEVFDRLASASPEAGVALYSFGSPDRLAAATREVVEHLDRLGLLGPDRDVLDLGCGIGRLSAALAPRVRDVLGLDLSCGMIDEARRRCAGFANVRFHHVDGSGTGFLPAASVDLVVAADVFPYLVQAGGGLAEAHICDFARMLRPGGSSMIFNFSYRGDLDADRRDVAVAAGSAGLQVVGNGSRDLTLWDAAAFLLAKPG